MKYCDHCDHEQPTREIVRNKEFTIRGKIIEIHQSALICSICENRVYDEALEEVTMQQISRAYVEQYGMAADVIRQIRGQYNLGIRPFAKILDMGTASVSRHEAGDLPSEKQLEIYRQLQRQPQLIQEYYRRNKGKLSSREQKQAEAALSGWQLDPMQQDEEIIEAIHKPYEQSELSGFSLFNLDKFVQMILFFTAGGVAKTKLMKLLWYADFLQFKRQTVSISGAVYVRYPFGPVPLQYDITLAHLENMETIDIEETMNDEGWTLMNVKAMHAFDSTSFEPDELLIMEEVKEFFAGYGSRKISDYSHEEAAWIENDDEQPISYKYAAALRQLR